MKDRIILHLDMDAFFAQVEERLNPRFKGLPLVVGADPKNGFGRGVVSTANYEARKYGIHSALPISKAYRLCPTAIFLPVNMDLYQRVSGKIMDIVKTYSAICEQVSVDEAYLDLSFLENYDKALVLAQKIKKEIFDKEKLTLTIGIGPNKTICKMATNQAKPDGLLCVRPEDAEEFLNPLDVQDLPGVGPKTAEKLREIGINKIKDLREISKLKLKELFGAAGEAMYEKIRGADDAPVATEKSVKSIGRSFTFEKDTRDPEIIFNVFNDLIKEVGRELLAEGFSFKTITVVCRFQGFETHDKSKTFKRHTKNPMILKKESKIMLLKFLVGSKKLIRLVGLRASNLKQ